MLEQFNALFADYPLVANTISLTLSGAIIALLWKGPGWISKYIVKMFFTSVTFNNSGYLYVTNYQLFIEWFHSVQAYKVSRSYALESSMYKESHSSLGPGPGHHFMYYKGGFFWVHIEARPSEGTEKEKRQATVYVLGTSNKRLMSYIESFAIKSNKDDRHLHVHVKEGRWINIGLIPERPIKTVALNEEKKEEVFGTIRKFLDNKRWYKDRGIPYKLVILFYGPPGTGKTSLIKSIAHEFRRNIYMLNISNINDTELETAIYGLPTGPNLISIEDIDSNKAIHRVVPGEEPIKDDTPESKRLSRTTVLNVLDGVKEFDGEIVCISTNHLELIDEAVVRPGRVDKRFFIDYLTAEDIKAYLDFMYPDVGLDVPNNLALSGAALQELVLTHKQDVKGFYAGWQKLVKDNA